MVGWRYVRMSCAWVLAALASVAVSSVGAVSAGAAALPDGRKAELVSPPDKNGGDVLVRPDYTAAAADGGSTTFASLTAFADPVGTGLDTEYRAERVQASAPGTNGWAVHAITPLQTALPAQALLGGLRPSYIGFSSDLNHGVFRAWSPLTDDPWVAHVVNLYTRSDLQESGSDPDTLVTACSLCQTTLTPLSPIAATPYSGFPALAGFSEDGLHVLFESRLKLTGEAVDGTMSGTSNLYVADDGHVELAAVLPDGSSAPGAVAGQGAAFDSASLSYTPHVLSSDGLRYVFTADVTSCAPAPGAIFSCGALFVRDRSGVVPVTANVNASQRSTPDPGGPLPAIYWDASDDGTKIFFTTAEQLTDADTNTTWDLYRYDENAPVGARLTLLSHDPAFAGTPADVEAVLGVGGDGNTAYFAAPGQLVAGGPPVGDQADGIYAWRDTGGGVELHYVGDLGKATGMLPEVETAGQNVVGGSRHTRVSPDGRYLLFPATHGENLLSVHGETDYDHGTCNDLGLGSPGCREYYLYDSATEQLDCVSCRPDGTAATVSANTIASRISGPTTAKTYLNHPLTANGRWVFFSTQEALVPEDVNDRLDVYEWDRTTGSVHLLSDGIGLSDSYFLDASPSGDDIFIATRTRLTGWDIDNSYDLYDLRRPFPGHPAGFPEPPPPPPPAPGLGPATGGPSEPAIGSLAFRGPGNVRPALHRTRRHAPKRCKQGRVRRRIHGHVRCVKRHGRHANATRRVIGRAGRR